MRDQSKLDMKLMELKELYVCGQITEQQYKRVKAYLIERSG
jgi:hypothetical protein